MNKLLRYSIATLGAALLLFLVVYAARGEPDAIIIENADESREMPVAGDAILSGLLGEAAPHFTLEFANGSSFINLGPIPDELQTMLDQVTTHFLIEYANQTRFLSLPTMPAELLAVIGQVAPRFVIEYANSNRYAALNYPAGLVNDTSAPVILFITADLTEVGQFYLRWTTDELTTAYVEYGLQPGMYTGLSEEPDFLIQHETTTTLDLGSRTWVYYQITCTDRSGNTTVSPEYSVNIEGTQLFMLPLILR